MDPDTAFSPLPLSALYCYTYANRTKYRISIRVYNADAPEGHPLAALRTPRERRNRVSEKLKRKLTDRQERRRIEGLRVLARIIARHYLANPHLYPNGSAPANGQPTDGGQAPGKEGAA